MVIDDKYLSVLRTIITYQKHYKEQEGFEHHLNNEAVHVLADKILENPSCLKIREKTEGLNIIRSIDISVLTAEKEVDNIDDLISSVYMKGMNKALEIVHKTKNIPFEAHVTCGFALGCASRDITEAIRQVKIGGW